MLLFLATPCLVVAVQTCMEWILIKKNTEEEKTETIPDDLQVQIKMYKDSESLEKHVILSLINHSKYSMEQIIIFFNVLDGK